MTADRRTAPFDRAGVKRIGGRFLRQRRRAEDLTRLVDGVIDGMRTRGLTLNVTHRRTQSVWQLSNGAVVAPEVAEKVVGNTAIVGVGDCLFDDRGLSQTFRFVEQKEEGPAR
jgi:hypothetical protein